MCSSDLFPSHDSPFILLLLFVVLLSLLTNICFLDYILLLLCMCWYFRSYPDGAGISSKCHVSVILLLSCSKFDWFTPQVRYFYPDSWFVAEKVSSTLSGVVIMITSGLYTPCDVL